MGIWETREGQIFVAKVEQFLSDRKKETPTLRDTFAMNALNGLLKESYSTEGLARKAYEIADAMLAVRKESK